MPTIKNKLDQAVLISLTEGRSVELLASGTATVAARDMASSHLSGFIERGDIVVLAEDEKQAEKKQDKKERTRS